MADTNYLRRVVNASFNGTDEATAFTTEDKFGHVLTFTGGAKLEATGAITGATSLYLDGVDDYVEIATNDNWQMVPSFGNFGIEFDFKSIAAAEPGANVTFASMWDTGGSDRGWLLYWDTAANKIEMQISANGSTTPHIVLWDQDTDAAGAINLWDGASHHVTVYCYNGTMVIAVDGNVGADTESVLNGPFVDTATTWQPIRIGCHFVSGAATGFLEGMIDNFRFTNGVSPYTATTGTITPDTRPFDLVDGTSKTAYSYPATLPLMNAGAEEIGHFPWETGIPEAISSPDEPCESANAFAAQAGSYYFYPTKGTSTNTALSVSKQRLDIAAQMNASFLTDIDFGSLLLDMSGWSYLNTTGRGFGRFSVKFLDESLNEIGAWHSAHSIPGTLSTWTEVTKNDVQVPSGTRYIDFYHGIRKDTAFHTSTNFFWDSFALSLKERSDSKYHNVYHLSVADMVATWVASATITSNEPNSGTQEKAWFPYVRASTTLTGAEDMYSPLYDLQTDPVDIDAGDAEYIMESVMAGDSDTCYMWMQFFQSDGVTTVGSRISSTAKTHDTHGEIIRLAGTIPANARKVQLGFNTANAAAGSFYDAQDVMFVESAFTVTGISPIPNTGGAISTVIIVG